MHLTKTASNQEKIAEALWPAARVPKLLSELAYAAGLQPRNVELSAVPEDSAVVVSWLQKSCDAMSIESEFSELYGFDLQAKLRTSAPAIIHFDQYWIGILDVNRDSAQLLTPDSRKYKVALQILAGVLLSRSLEPHLLTINNLLNTCDLTGRRRTLACEILAGKRMRNEKIAMIWRISTPPKLSFRRQLTDLHLPRQAALLVSAHLIQYTLLIGSWWLLGRDALAGRVNSGWLIAWALLLVTAIPLRLWTTWAAGLMTVAFGSLLRQKLLSGALALSPEKLQSEGIGTLMGRAIEAETLENLVLSGGLSSALAGSELLLAAWIVYTGEGGILRDILLITWIVVIALVFWRYYLLRMNWTATRVAITHGMIERMIGHRTQVAQQPSSEWHQSDDIAITNYIRVSARMDAANTVLMGLLPRLWLITSIASLIPAFLSARPEPGILAVSVGGILFAYSALQRLVAGLADIAGALVSWQQVAPIFQASATNETIDTPMVPLSSKTVIDARALVFQYPDTIKPALTGINLQIKHGDWILLEGNSGGGKSTLVSILAGLRQPQSGLLLTGGFDLRSIGASSWRRRIAAAPQFHENHVLTGPLAFNLLMGRKWPPQESDMVAADTICRELGLGALLDQMPAGIMQMVGDTGWQLSQGERSRLFLARALLQEAELLIFDESFAALDPENLRQALDCVFRRARTVLVVAHP